MTSFKNPPRPMSDDDLVIPVNARKTVTTLMPDDCRWPSAIRRPLVSISAANASRMGIPIANSTSSAPARPAGRAR